MVVTPQQTLTSDEKREVLEAVLASATFARAAQLRAFLRHVCEMELSGRAQELTEYEIAVEVLGRRKDFDLAEDSTVRNRAYELRQRLEKYYATEQPHATVRIEIPRGGYAPTYVRHNEAAEAALVVAVPPEPAIVEREPVKASWRPGWLTVAAVAALFSIASWITASHFARVKTPAILAEAWGPLAAPGNDVVISIATNLHLIVRPHIPPQSRRFPAPEALYPLYRETRPYTNGDPIYMEPAMLSVPLAELAATTTLANARQAMGGSYQILPEAEAPAASLRDRNAIVIGTSVNSQTVAALLRNTPLNIVFDSEDRFAIIDQRKPAGQNQVYSAQPGSGPITLTLYGLLTVFSDVDSAGRPKRMAVISGTGSAGVQAVAEFFSSPARMAEMKQRFRSEGLPGFPASYQVVVSCKTYGIRLMSYEYAAHAIIQK